MVQGECLKCCPKFPPRKLDRGKWKIDKSLPFKIFKCPQYNQNISILYKRYDYSNLILDR